MKTIIFDLGGVLIDWNPRYLYRQLFQEETEMEYFLQQICTSDWNERQDGGRSLAEGTNILVQQYPEHEANIRAFYSRWEEMLGGVVEETLEILKQLKQQNNYQLYALTNWSAETFPIAQERYEFLSWFEDILVSGQEKMRKPQPEIYQLMLDRFDIEAASSLFIDDNLRNVRAAREMSIDTIHFTTPENLQSELQKRSIAI